MTSDFGPYLEKGEVVRWTGRPKQGLAFRSIDALLIPFSLMWCGGAVFWEVTALNTSGSLFMALWGVPFISAGLYLVVGRFFVDAFLRSKVRYALTDRRALILGGFNERQLTEVDLRSTPEISYDLNGTVGSITFGPRQPFRGGADIWHSTSKIPPRFFRIEAADAAARIIRAARSDRGRPGEIAVT